MPPRKPELARAEALADLPGRDRAGVPLAVAAHGLHELVGHADRVVRVLEEDRGVGLAVERGVVAGLDEGPDLALLGRTKQRNTSVRSGHGS